MEKFICDNAFNLKKNVLIMRPSRLCVFFGISEIWLQFLARILLWASLGNASPPSSHLLTPCIRKNVEAVEIDCLCRNF